MTHDEMRAIAEAQNKRRIALIERLGTFADLLCSNPLPGDSGDVAYDLLRQAAAQISSDRLVLADLAAKDARLAVMREALTRTQWMLETVVRTNSFNFKEVHERIIANRPALADQPTGDGG